MKREPFNANWQVTLQGESDPAISVTLPHDAMIGQKRRNDGKTTRDKGFFPQRRLGIHEEIHGSRRLPGKTGHVGIRGCIRKSGGFHQRAVCRGTALRYYLFYALNMSPVISVAVCDTPAGEYKFYGHICGTKKNEVNNFDPGVFLDDDQRFYLYTRFADKLWAVNMLAPTGAALVSIPILLKYKLRDNYVKVMTDCNNGRISRAEAEKQLPEMFNTAIR